MSNGATVTLLDGYGDESVYPTPNLSTTINFSSLTIQTAGRKARIAHIVFANTGGSVRVISILNSAFTVITTFRLSGNQTVIYHPSLFDSDTDGEDILVLTNSGTADVVMSVFRCAIEPPVS